MTIDMPQAPDPELQLAHDLAREKIAAIPQAFDEKGKESLEAIKEHLGDEFSYGEIRQVLQSLRVNHAS